MAGPRVRPLPAAVFALSCLLALVSVPLSAGREPVVDTVMYPTNAVVLGLAGLLVTLHLPRHPVGLLLAGLGLQAAFTEVAEGYGYHDTLPAALTAQWMSSWGSVIGAAGTSTLLALFPDGRPAGRRWAWVPAFTALAVLAMVAGNAFTTANDASYAYTRGGNPYAVEGWDRFYPVALTLWVAGLLLAIASLVARFRRARGAERQQLKLIFWFACVLAVVGPVAVLGYNSSEVVQWVIALVVPLLPATICVAVLRYRLYDVDLLIARTVGYAVLSLILLAAWGVTALVLGSVLGRGSAGATAGATAAAAAVFLPLRQRVQDAVDRTFRRARYDSLGRVDGYLEDLRSGRASVDQLTGVLRDALDDPDLELHLLLPGEQPLARPGSPDGVTLVERSGVPLAEVTHSRTDPGRLPEVLARAGLAIEIARLQAEVRHRLAEVEASRARIVSAAHEERRRLERDLHDGAQQRLVSAGLALRHVQHELGEQPVALGIEAVVTELAGAIDELRSLAQGVRPARLDDGLEPALRELAGRSALPVRVEAAAGPLPDPVVATAYYVAAEALTNAVKHSSARSVHLTVGREGDLLVLTVRDDGIGGATPETGSGLRGLADRVAALGGRLRLDSPAGAGTTVTVRLPCAS